MIVRRKIRDLGRIITGNTPATTNRDYYGDYALFIKATDIDMNHKFTTETEECYSKIAAEKYKQNLVPKGSTCVVTIGSIGKKITMAHQDLFVNQAINAVVPKDCYDSDYIYYLLKNNLVQLKMLDSGTASGRENVSKSSFSNITVEMNDDKYLQNRIGNILSAYDDLIENNIKRIELIEQMAENLYREWFVRFRFPGHENIEFENGLPCNWEVRKLGDFANITTGKCNRQDAEEYGEYPLFDRSQEIKRSSTWIKDCEAIIVPGEGTSFIPRYYKGKFNLHQRCYCVEPINEGTGKFLFYTLMLNRLYFLSVATGATVPSLRQNNFTSMKFVMPPVEMCQKYEEIVSCFFEKIEQLKKMNENLTKQRDLLLPRLMSGKLEVK